MRIYMHLYSMYILCMNICIHECAVFFCFVFARPDALRFQRLSIGQAWLESHQNRKACEELWTCFTWEGFLDDLENCWYM